MQVNHDGKLLQVGTASTPAPAAVTGTNASAAAAAAAGAEAPGGDCEQGRGGGLTGPVRAFGLAQRLGLDVTTSACV